MSVQISGISISYPVLYLTKYHYHKHIIIWLILRVSEGYEHFLHTNQMYRIIWIISNMNDHLNYKKPYHENLIINLNFHIEKCPYISLWQTTFLIRKDTILWLKKKIDCSALHYCVTILTNIFFPLFSVWSNKKEIWFFYYNPFHLIQLLV